jgi:hypothetical protein
MHDLCASFQQAVAMMEIDRLQAGCGSRGFGQPMVRRRGGAATRRSVAFQISDEATLCALPAELAPTTRR